MRPLTEFQVKCEDRLNQMLFLCGILISNRRIIGESETYINIKLNIRDIEVWIYKHECMFVCDGNDVHFEAADYPEELELINEFISSIKNCVLGDERFNANLGSGFVKLFNGKKL